MNVEDSTVFTVGLRRTPLEPGYFWIEVPVQSAMFVEVQSQRSMPILRPSVNVSTITEEVCA